MTAREYAKDIADGLEFADPRTTREALIKNIEKAVAIIIEACAKECDAIEQHYREDVKLFEETNGLSMYSTDGAQRCAFALRQKK